ncbi:TetR/AcrR family transcriptional regulator [Vibrio vulnificus]|uniref:TetR/AcrR family transcriptional regulator n=1 Tax=Vibrio vulnificus TaxID=672 RepID=UPI00076B3D69|nr:TetR/AcrR family transcriptional regulator [Vibrio vulnificus]AMG13510.1 TetR family transcriptional regulator [Vibrio vulnificus]EGQ9883094.1 TetR/AcrR family transcriptional regulator [Vibrio vulnificus]EGR0237479.1 TetR/AcrR family transcriptional regulator [Vibrio vulnificus]EGR1869089.1 TetR/AcrR family transcriptional regulator [Vibrio vulnificus]EHU5198039.1 TetR/AcrR family transcriptional regulator [Vibrio vulnificus]
MSSEEQNDKQQQILAAAEKLIAESGFQGLSMSKLAKEAGVAAGTIYRYFDDKEHLLDELRLRITQRVATAIQAKVTHDMPLKQQYRTMWLNTWNLAASNLSTLSNRIQYESLPCSNSHKTRELEKKMFHQVALMFDMGKEQGVFKTLDNEILFGLSLETSVRLAKKHALGFYQLDDKALDAAIDASWDAIINH